MINNDNAFRVERSSAVKKGAPLIKLHVSRACVVCWYLCMGTHCIWRIRQAGWCPKLRILRQDTCRRNKKALREEIDIIAPPCLVRDTYHRLLRHFALVFVPFRHRFNQGHERWAPTRKRKIRSIVPSRSMYPTFRCDGLEPGSDGLAR